VKSPKQTATREERTLTAKKTKKTAAKSEQTSLQQPGECLVLKVVGPGGESHGNFIWPLEVGATVRAPDWRPTKACGNGLHGWHYGAGRPDVAGERVEDEQSRWLLLAVTESSIIDLDGMVKFEQCRIAFVAAESGPKGRAACVSVLLKYAPVDKAPNWMILAGGVRSNLAGGVRSNLAGGEASNLAGGVRSSLAGGVRSNLAGGEASNLAGGYASNLAGGVRSNLAGGEASNLAGGAKSAVSTGADGLATCGEGGIVRGGKNAVLVALYSTGPDRGDFSYSIGQVGKGDVLPDVWYEGSPDGLRLVPDTDRRVQDFDARSKDLAESKAEREKQYAEGIEKSDAAPRVYLKKGEELRAKVVPPSPPEKAKA